MQCNSNSTAGISLIIPDKALQISHSIYDTAVRYAASRSLEDRSTHFSKVQVISIKFLPRFHILSTSIASVKNHAIGKAVEAIIEFIENIPPEKLQGFSDPSPAYTVYETNNFRLGVQNVKIHAL
jgi:hypothetical protein